MMLGPGKNWHSPSKSANSAAVIQRRRSTIIRRAQGSTPPKPHSPTLRKPRNSPPRLGGDGDVDMAHAYTKLKPVVRSGVGSSARRMVRLAAAIPLLASLAAATQTAAAACAVKELAVVPLRI